MEQETIKYMGKLYTVSKEIAETIKSSRRKMKYQTRDIKNERFESDQDKSIARFTPSREDSFDRLLDEKVAEFATDDERIEDTVERQMLCAMLPAFVSKLNSDERYLLHLSFWCGLNDEEIGEILQLERSTICKRKGRALDKLLKMLEM